MRRLRKEVERLALGGCRQTRRPDLPDAILRPVCRAATSASCDRSSLCEIRTMRMTNGDDACRFDAPDCGRSPGGPRVCRNRNHGASDQRWGLALARPMLTQPVQASDRHGSDRRRPGVKASSSNSVGPRSTHHDLRPPDWEKDGSTRAPHHATATGSGIAAISSLVSVTDRR